MLVTEASPMERQERRVWFIRQAVSVSVESNISDASKWCIGALGTVGWNKCSLELLHSHGYQFYGRRSSVRKEARSMKGARVRELVEIWA
jgi:hypothetical protein